ncbi:MAG: PilZ domain-containing protein [Pyrinomonadaceae bacterium]
MDERRKHPRKSVSLEIRWEGLTGKYEARLSDIGAGGCFVDTLGGAEPGEIISFAVRLPHSGWLELQGRVVSTDPTVGFSVAYHELTLEQRDELDLLVNSLA